ncbi:capsid cement protein [Zhihengliuella halotolerans]|uniref:Uncharacterized protein DUF2190 n=1 Tax=Zhihengliuella halotolerans TaxID=370736 RepID=A0A4Q8AC25_9MICC|nr:capsid cement protein [Zhihengliuella halotolerans]RZU61747.1 uncharacterized protein DUF2190 [Zhihengliuella halotolerans]
MAQHVPMFGPTTNVTCTASDDVVGGKIVEITGDRTVAHAGADSAATLGVAGFDAATGDNVTVYAGGVQPLTAAEAVAAGAPVYAGAAGDAAATGTNPIGTALTAAATAGDLFQVRLTR